MQLTLNRSTLLVVQATISLLVLAAGSPARGQEIPALKQAFAKDFLIGAALSRSTVTGADQLSATIAAAQFNAATPENDLKWGMVHPRPGVYAFEGSDAYVSFCERNQMTVIGHTLVWHSQTPKWVFEGAPGKPVDRATLIERMRDHIHSVVGRYKGRIRGWDVVNEALEEGRYLSGASRTAPRGSTTGRCAGAQATRCCSTGRDSANPRSALSSKLPKNDVQCAANLVRNSTPATP